MHGHLGGLPPTVDLAAERVLGEILVAASRDGMVDAAHDLSDGGLAIALAEGCLRYGVGARVWLDELCERDGIDPFVALFSESTARVIVSVPRSEEVRFTDMCTARGVAHLRIGVVDDESRGPRRPGPVRAAAGRAADRARGHPARRLRELTRMPEQFSLFDLEPAAEPGAEPVQRAPAAPRTSSSTRSRSTARRSARTPASPAGAGTSARSAGRPGRPRAASTRTTGWS